MQDDRYVDDVDEPDPELNRLTNAIIGAAMQVHTQLKPGLLEFLYEQAVAIELRRRGIPFERQVVVPVHYKGELIGEQRIDFVIDRKVVVDLKTVDQFAPVHAAQMICYLSLTRCKLGLLLNFKVRALKDGIKRIAR